jgi:endonuclease G, mitochondrial
MKNLLPTLVLLVTASGLSAQDFDYLPTLTGNQVVAYTQFTLSYNEDHEQAEWVAYELTKEEAEMSRDRCDCFASDQSIDTKSAKQRDYTSSGFDRGHLAPAADNNMSDEANRESFLFSNMSPQLPYFNRNGAWVNLEEWVREKAIEFEKVYVVTGPVFVNNLGTLGNNEVTIPGYFYKVLLRFDGTTPKTIAFLLPQDNAVGELSEYVVTVNTIESLTGLDFYPELANSTENRVESQYAESSWGVN